MDKKLDGLEEKTVLTLREAYEAMFVYLERYYERSESSDDIAIMLGKLNLDEDGRPMDPAALDDWLDAVHEVLRNRPSDGHTGGENPGA